MSATMAKGIVRDMAKVATRGLSKQQREPCRRFNHDELKCKTCLSEEIMYMYMYTYTYMSMYLSLYIHTHTCTYIYIYIYIYVICPPEII